MDIFLNLFIAFCLVCAPLPKWTRQAYAAPGSDACSTSGTFGQLEKTSKEMANTDLSGFVRNCLKKSWEANSPGDLLDQAACLLPQNWSSCLGSVGESFSVVSSFVGDLFNGKNPIEGLTLTDVAGFLCEELVGVIAKALSAVILGAAGIGALLLSLKSVLGTLKIVGHLKKMKTTLGNINMNVLTNMLNNMPEELRNKLVELSKTPEGAKKMNQICASCGFGNIVYN